MYQEIIINADDFGYSSSVNQAIALCFEKGFVNRTTIMANMPSFDDAVKLAKKNGFKQYVGLHLVLDEFSPLTNEMRRNPNFCNNGLFVKGWASNIKNKVFLSHYDINCIKAEVEAQMQAYSDAGFTLMHIDSHHLVHTSSPLITTIISDLALKHGFKSMRNVAIYQHDNFVNRLAKKYVQFIIKKNYKTTKYFTTYNDFNPILKNVEYMSHPDMFGDKLVNVLNRKTGEILEFKKMI